MKKIDRGIVLVTIMMLLSIVIMIAAMLLISGKNALQLGANFSDKEQALYAAECGVAYVQYCISRYTDWIGDEATLSNIYNPYFKEFSVEIIPYKGNGRCIHGILQNGRSEFYIAFYCGTSAFVPNNDIRNDKNGFPLRYYSCNNLSNAVSPVSSVYYDGSAYVSFRTAGAQQAHVIVEGRCNTSKRYVEAMLQKDTRQLGSTFSISAGDMNIGLTDTDSTFMVNSASSGGETKLRSLGDIKINSGDSRDKNCFQIANNGQSCTGKGSKGAVEKKNTYVNGVAMNKDTQDDYGLSVDNQSQTKYINNAKLSWEAVTESYLSENDFKSNVKATIKAGTWIYKNSKDDVNTYKLYYYNDKFDPKDDNFVNTHTGYEYGTGADDSTLITGSINVQKSVNMNTFIKNKGYLFNASDATGITPDIYGNSDFSLAVFSYNLKEDKILPSNSYRASFRLEGEAGKDPCLVSKTGGNIYIGGELSGNGKVLSGGNVSFQGKSMMEADKSAGVSLYAKGTVTINPVVGTGGGMADPNAALKAVWDTYTQNNHTLEYHNSGRKDYKDLTDDILTKTKVSGTFGNKSFTNENLINILTDDNSFGYDKKTAREMVSTLINKNTYKGEDYTPAHDTTQKMSYTGTEEFLYDGKETHWFDLDKDEDGTRDYMCFHVETRHKDANGNTIAWDTDLHEFDLKTGQHIQWYGTIDEPGTSWTDWHERTNPNHGTVLAYSEKAPGEIDLSSFKVRYNGASGNSVSMDMNISKPGEYSIKYQTPASAKKSETIMMLDTQNSKFSSIDSNDTILKGLVYTWEDLYGPNLQGGSLTIRGAVVAYGGNPDMDDPGDNGKGGIHLNNGRNITFTYDPDYLNLLLANNMGLNTIRVFHATF